MSAAGPWAVLSLRHSQVGLGPRVGLPRTQAEPLCGGWPVGVPQHGVKGPGEVVGLRAAVVLLGGGQQAGQEQQQQEQQLQGQCRPEHPGQEGALWPRAAWVGRARQPGNREGGELSRRGREAEPTHGACPPAHVSKMPRTEIKMGPTAGVQVWERSLALSG